jgi:small-conductance mechanosensitive channel
MHFDTWGQGPWIVIPLIFLCWVLVLATAKKIVFVIIRKLAAKTENQIDDLVLEALDFPLQLIVYASGVLVVQNFIPKTAGGEDVLKYLLDGFKVVVIIAGVMFVDRFLRGLIRLYAQKVDILRTSGNFAQGIVRIVIIGLAALILLDTFGVSITPIIASLGIGSLAVALALQPTLENFFSGIQLVADKPIQIGQFVKLESGEEGYVEKIGWRSTWIRMTGNNMVIVPNKVLVNARLTNYDYPDKENAVLVPVGVHYSSDLEKVERATIEVAREVMKQVAGGVPSYEPLVRFHTFADSSVNFTVVMRAREYGDSHLIKHEFVKRLHKRYAQEGICIPYPIRAVNYEQEKASSST